MPPEQPGRDPVFIYHRHPLVDSYTNTYIIEIHSRMAKNGRKSEVGNNIQKIFNDLSLSQNPAFSAQLFLSDHFETKMLYNADVIVVHDMTEPMARKERTARRAKESPTRDSKVINKIH